ncbi:MAG: hypothetical protein ABIK97_08110 [candidate division WOR-3 bacterium]
MGKKTGGRRKKKKVEREIEKGLREKLSFSQPKDVLEITNPIFLSNGFNY